MNIYISKSSGFLLLLLVIFLTFALHIEDASSAWITTTVDSDGNVGSDNSLAIDSSGKIHINYFDLTNFDIKYATNAPGFWVSSTVESVGGTGSLAVDSLGNAHISYYDVADGDLKYATNTPGFFVTETIDSNGDVGAPSSIAIDSSDNVHISYYDFTNGDLKYATNASSSFVTGKVDSSGDVGSFNSIAIDPSGNAHISYYDWTNNDLKYATNTPGFFVTETIDSSGDVGWPDTSIAIDSSGKTHISYYDMTNSNLKYATNTSGFFVTAAVDSDIVLRYIDAPGISIVVDSSDRVHISYFDGKNHDLKYATNIPGFFVTETIDSSGWVGRYSSIATDPSGSGKIHISYYDDTNGDLKYASSAISIPTGQQSFAYNPISTPILNINPADAKPIGLGPLADGGNTLAVQIGLEQFERAVDIFGAYTVSTDPEHVYVLNPDGSSFTLFTISDINNALATGIPPSGAEPWRSFILGSIEEELFNIPISSLPSGTYTIYLMVTKTGFVIILGNQAQSLNDHYLWSTSFVVP